MEELFVAILSMLLVVGLIPLYIWKRRQDSGSPDEQQEEPQHPETVARATGASRTRMRRRPVTGASSSRASADIDEDNVDEGDDSGKPSKKREKKRQEREAQRQAIEAARESKSSKQDYYAEMRRKKDKEHEAKERMLEKEAKARKAKEEKAADLEFHKWKGEFSVVDEGTMENEAEDGNQSLLSGFVDYIKNQKCVPLEDLAGEFKMRTQECINRITSLESMGRLSGIMDGRGKYIYISVEEMKAVAEYIKREGRVSISHLARKSNQFVDLEPKPEFVEGIAAAT